MDFPLNQSLLGRIANLPLSPSSENSLVPLFEAIMNGFHSIEEREAAAPGFKGQVKIEVVDDPDGRPLGFIVSDNGVGMTDDNFESFRTSDSDRKLQRGGKGVGRLTWLKVFGGSRVRGWHREGAGVHQVSFDFVRDQGRTIQNYTKTPIADRETGLVVELQPFERAYAEVVPRKTDTIKRSIIRHFLSQILSPNAPEIIFERDGEVENLKKHFLEIVNKRDTESYSVVLGEESHELIQIHMLVDKNFRERDLGDNLVFLNAHGRAVESIDISSQIGMSIIAEQFVYLGVVSGQILDDHVSPERGRFTLETDALRSIRGRAISAAREYLKPYIERIREEQVAQVGTVARTYPRFLNTIGDPKIFVEKNLSPSQRSVEDVYMALSLRNFREIRERENSYRQERAAGMKAQDLISQKTKSYLEFVSEESAAVLADYMVRRRAIISVLEDITGLEDLEKRRNFLEEVVHSTICPLGSTLDELPYSKHNLWIIDDRLAYYNYFISDVGLKNVVVATDSGLEPDLTFFDLGLGFQREKTTDPVLIIEFKRPGRNDYTRDKNPVVQAIDYIQKIRNGQLAVDRSGRRLSYLGEDTPFACKIIADITPTLKEAILGYPVKYPTPDGRGLYGYMDELKAVFEITPYDKLIDDVVARHEMFFEKLGVKP